MLSLDLNIQLFITTHNIETLNYFKEALENKALEGLKNKSKIFSLVQTKKGINAYSYTFDNFKDAIEYNNEIRD